jgi:hypothetical protein
MSDETQPAKQPVWFSQADWFQFSSLMLLTSFFLPWWGDTAPFDSAWDTDSTPLRYLWTLAFCVLTIPLATSHVPILRPWAALFTALVVWLGITLHWGSAGYGAHLAQACSIIQLFSAVPPALLKSGDFAIRHLNSQKADIFNHWGTALNSVQFSAQEFYRRVEEAVREREWPGVELVRLTHSEAGLLSHKREYLRVVRQRQVFDICAGSFGRDYFFTVREAEMKPQVTLVTFIIFVVTLLLIFSLGVRLFGFFPGIFVFCIATVSGAFLMWNALRMGLTRLDGLLMRTPVIGPIYETWFRRSTTYFQHDTRVVFLKLMDDLLKEAVDEETSAKGIKLLESFEHQPLFHGFYEIKERTTTKQVK